MPDKPTLMRNTTLPGTGSWLGTPYRYRIIRAKRGISLVMIGIERPGTARFLLRRENTIDRLAKRFGLAGEWQTGDPSFDEHVYIQSDDQRLHELLSVDNRLRRAVAELFQLPYIRSLELAGGMLRLLVRFDRKQHMAPTDAAIADRVAAQVLPQLTPVGQRFGSIAGEGDRHRRDPGLARYRLLIGLAAVIGVAGFLSLFARPDIGLPRPLLRGEALTSALKIAIIAAAVGALIVFTALGRRSRTHRALAAVLFIAAPGIWCAALVHAERRNIVGATMGEPFETRLVEKTQRRTKGRYAYYLELEALPDSRMSRNLRVTTRTWNGLTDGQCLRLDIRDGSLGDPVLAGIEPVACRD